MKLLSKILISLAVISAVVLVSTWLFGPQSAGAALLMVCIAVGGYVGAGWGGRQAAKTDEYRQKWLSQRRGTPPPQNGEPGSTPEDPKV